MADFLLDFRPRADRFLADAASGLEFAKRLRVTTFDLEPFGLVVTWCGSDSLWAPYVDPNGSIFAVAGMAAFDETEWKQAETVPGPGGLAAKAIRQRHRQGGLDPVEQVSGNHVILVYDAPGQQLHVVTDCAGAFPTFECQTASGWVFGSHPDIVARAAGEQHRLDEISQAELVLASMVTPPFTFYQRVRATDHGTTLSLRLDPGRESQPSRRTYFRFDYQGDDQPNESQLAEELAAAFRIAVRRRTLPRLGRAVVALSGGLDSRLLLACLENKSQAFAFCLYDRPNRELSCAAAVAAAAGVRFLPMQRPPDYYAENAELGVRVSGGMGTLANNHFLGVLDGLQAEGMDNLLTGCYCDYLFKGLPLNRTAHWLTGREQLAPVSHEFYFNRWTATTPLSLQARQRWDARVSQDFQPLDSPAKLFDLEVRRTFPLCYEGDNQQRVVPQRLTGWYLPVADRQVLEVYRRIPSRMKLNRSIFLKTARILLAGSPIARVPDANTGARIDASPATEWASFNWLRVKRKLRSLRRSLGSDGSWPDWQFYLTHSPRMAELWRRPNPAAFDFFRRVMGWQTVPAEPRDFEDGRVFLFVPLLTHKIWLEQRACSNA